MARLQRVLLWALALTETLADVPEALAGQLEFTWSIELDPGDDECLVGGCSTDLLQVNRSSGGAAKRFLATRGDGILDKILRLNERILQLE